jgi:hypothetical protein
MRLYMPRCGLFSPAGTTGRIANDTDWELNAGPIQGDGVECLSALVKRKDRLIKTLALRRR